MSINHRQNIIEIKNVSFSYGKEVVLENINLNIHKGDYLGIIGPNGGGKTTLLKLILGLLKPQIGTINLSNSPIGYVAQKATNFDNNFPISVRDVISQGRITDCGLFHNLTADDWKSVDRAIDLVGLSAYKNKLIGDLSGGQQQRVFIARAITGRHSHVIILDEPTAGVDKNSQENFYSLLKELNQKLEMTIILVSHDIDVIASETTELACVNKHLIYDNNPENFLRSEKLKKLYGGGVRFVFHTH
jgi:zinc transport system ATP-binding protein